MEGTFVSSVKESAFVVVSPVEDSSAVAASVTPGRDSVACSVDCSTVLLSGFRVVSVFSRCSVLLRVTTEEEDSDWATEDPDVDTKFDRGGTEEEREDWEGVSSVVTEVVICPGCTVLDALPIHKNTHVLHATQHRTTTFHVSVKANEEGSGCFVLRQRLGLHASSEKEEVVAKKQKQCFGFSLEEENPGTHFLRIGQESWRFLDGKKRLRFDSGWFQNSRKHGGNRTTRLIV